MLMSLCPGFVCTRIHSECSTQDSYLRPEIAMLGVESAFFVVGNSQRHCGLSMLGGLLGLNVRPSTKKITNLC